MRYRFTTIPTHFTGAIAGDGYGTVPMAAGVTVFPLICRNLQLRDLPIMPALRSDRIRSRVQHPIGSPLPLTRQHWHWQLHRWQVQHT